MDWEAALAITEAVVAEIFDRTPCRLQPRSTATSVNHPAGNDPGREPFDFLGTIELEPPSDRISRHMPADPGVRNGTVSYDAVLTALVSDLWPYLPRRNDHVVSDGVIWKIEAAELDGSKRHAWYLSKER